MVIPIEINVEVLAGILDNNIFYPKNKFKKGDIITCKYIFNPALDRKYGILFGIRDEKDNEVGWEVDITKVTWDCSEYWNYDHFILESTNIMSCIEEGTGYYHYYGVYKDTTEFYVTFTELSKTIKKGKYKTKTIGPSGWGLNFKEAEFEVETEDYTLYYIICGIVLIILIILYMKQ